MIKDVIKKVDHYLFFSFWIIEMPLIGAFQYWKFIKYALIIKFSLLKMRKFIINYIICTIFGTTEKPNLNYIIIKNSYGSSIFIKNSEFYNISSFNFLIACYYSNCFKYWDLIAFLKDLSSIFEPETQLIHLM